MCAQSRSSCSARQKHNLQPVIFFKIYFENSFIFVYCQRILSVFHPVASESEIVSLH